MSTIHPHIHQRGKREKNDGEVDPLEITLDHQRVSEFCGVDGAEPGTLVTENQLKGGKTKTKSPTDVEISKQNKKAREAQGSAVYSTFVFGYAALMYASFAGLIPEHSMELFDIDTVNWYSEEMGKSMYVPFVFAGLYVFVVFGIQSFLKDQSAFDLKYPLAAWSTFLGVFSILGSLRTVPIVFSIIQEKGFEHLLCGDSRHDWLINNAAGSWTIAFILSKVPELVDTLFIVLRKRKLITLHWYHHITVMLFTWHSMATMCMNGVIFAAMNLTVHSFMYIFYAMTALGFRPVQWAKSITMIQIAQLLAGTMVTTYVLRSHILSGMSTETLLTGPTPHFDAHSATQVDDGMCKVHAMNALGGFSMYASYLYLFSAFFVNTYMRKPTSNLKKKIN